MTTNKGVIVIILSLFVVQPFGAKAAQNDFNSLKKKGFQLEINQKNELLSLSGGTKNLPLSQAKTKPKEIGSQFFKDYGANFGVKNFAKELGFLSEQKDSFGLTHLKYEQKYNGVPVLNGGMMVHFDKTGVKSANGNLLKKIKINTTPKISKTKISDLSLKLAKSKFKFASAQLSEPKLYIYNRQVYDNTAPDKNYLAYQLKIYDPNTNQGRLILIDADTGKLLDSFDTTKTAMIRIVYNCNETEGRKCYLGNAPTGYDDGRAEGDGATGDVEVDSVYKNLGASYNYYKDVFGINGANHGSGTGRGVYAMATTAKTNYKMVRHEEDDPVCPNAYWDGYNNLVFCKQCTNATVVGHEYTHAVADFNGPTLAYQKEQGALEEAFADIFGLGIESYSTGTTSWKIGETSGSWWRDFKNPGGLPTHTYDPKVACSEDDYYGVHTNSMIIAHTFYLLAEGGQAPNGCYIQPMGQRAAEKLVWNAWQNYMFFGAGYQLFSFAMNMSCWDIYGYKTDTCTNVSNALTAAELNLPGLCRDRNKREWKKPVCQILKNQVQGINALIENGKETPKLINPEKETVIVTTEPAGIIPTISTSSSPSVEEKPATSSPTETINRTPSFDLKFTQDGNKLKLDGTINYYGQGGECKNPRYFDTVIIRWGDGSANEPVVSDLKFSGEHTYGLPKGKDDFDLSVTVWNGCFGNLTKHQHITPASL